MKKFMVFLSLAMVMVSSPVAYANKTLLAKVEMNGVAPEGGAAILYKTHKGCLIEYTQYYETGKQQYNYVFNKIGLVSASEIRFYYANGGLSNPENKSIKIAKQEKVFLDIKDEYTILDFKALKQKFRQSKLKDC